MHDEQQKLPAIFLSPRGPYRIGDLVSASWSMTNFADYDLAGARLFIDVPPAMDAVLASSTVQGVRGEAVAAAFSTDGFALGTIRRGDGINAVFDLRFARELAQSYAITAKLVIGENETYVSEPVDVVLRGRALLSLARAPRTCDVDAASGRLGVSFALENVGEMRAERVDLVVPAPAGLVLSRVRLSSGNEAAARTDTFRLPDIACGDTLDVVLEFETRGLDLGTHLELDGIRLGYSGGNFFFDPIAIVVDAEERALSGTLATAEPTVEPGSVIRLDLTIANAARADASGVVAAFDLPPQLQYCSGTIAVNGGSDARRDDPHSIAVGTVLGRSTTLVTLHATVVAPLPHDDVLEVGASVDGANVEAVRLTIKSEPSFPTTPHMFELDGASAVGAGESRTVRVRAANVGTADARDVRVRLISPHLVAERAAVVLSSGVRETIVMKSTVSRDGIPCSVADLGVVAARDIKTLEVDVRAPDHFSDGDPFTLRADLRFAGGTEFDIGEIALAGRARASIDASESGLTSSRIDPLRVGQVRSYTLRVKNAGLAAARGVVVSLNLPGMLAIEAVNGEATRLDVVTIREIPAGGAVEVPIALRLIESVDGGAALTIAPVVSGDTISTTALEPMNVAATGQSFLDEFVTRIERRERDLSATLHFRNVGDAIAHHVVVSALELPSAYLAGSTRLNDVPVPDFGGTSLLARGITLPPLAPGREIALSYRMAESEADGARVAFIVRTRAQDEILPEPATYRTAGRRPEVEIATREDVPHFVDDFAPFPRPATQTVPVPNGTFTGFSQSNGSNGNGSNGHGRSSAVAPVAEIAAAAVAIAPRAHGLVGYLVMDREEIDRIRRVADAALAIPALGTYRHFFAMRALVPQSLLGASPFVAAEWRAVHDRARVDLRGAFVQAAMPGFDASAAWAQNFQDRSSGEAAGRAIAAIRRAAEEDVTYDEAPVPEDQIRGAIGREFESYLSAVDEPSGNLLNLILAEALPTECPRDQHLSKALKRYRERLKLLFAALLYQDATARHERMLSGLDVELDDTLAAIAARLRDPRWA